jgi:hypothetical protein
MVYVSMLVAWNRAEPSGYRESTNGWAWETVPVNRAHVAVRAGRDRNRQIKWAVFLLEPGLFWGRFRGINAKAEMPTLTKAATMVGDFMMDVSYFALLPGRQMKALLLCADARQEDERGLQQH